MGVWYDMADAKKVRSTDTTKLLAVIGYGVKDIDAAEWAFLRHFNPDLYEALGGKKGANCGGNGSLRPRDNIEFVRTVQAVAARFAELRGGRQAENLPKIGRGGR